MQKPEKSKVGVKYDLTPQKYRQPNSKLQLLNMTTAFKTDAEKLWKLEDLYR